MRSSKADRDINRSHPQSQAIFGWYASVRPQLSTIAPGDLLASWQHVVTPVLWPIGEAPTEHDTGAAPGQYFTDAAGMGYAKAPLAQPEPTLDGVVVLTFDSAGIAIVTADRATHDREAALRVLPTGDDPAIRGLRQLAAERLPSGRRDGLSDRTGKSWRRGHDPVAIARALVARALVDLGRTHRSAIREWLHWEHSLGGEYGDAEAFEAMKRGHRPLLRPYEDRAAATNRRVWSELRANLYPKPDPERPEDAGHGPVRPPRPQRVPRTS